MTNRNFESCCFYSEVVSIGWADLTANQ